MPDVYDNPLISRYASRARASLWGAQRKFSTWRRLWVALAEAEAELGLPISEAQLAEMRAKVDDIDFAAAAAHEKRLRHDVMAHVHTYGDACPAAKPIIHLGATSNFVVDNADLVLTREAFELVARRLAEVIDALGRFIAEHRDLPTLGFTHLQPAQPTTVGKRATLWCYDLALDLAEVEHRLASLRARSTKGTTGTQASFLELFEGDHAKVRELERRVAAKVGFDATYAVTGQTYPRKVDAQVLDCLAGVAASAHKATTDLRILAMRKEIEEPFEASQIGSSAMPYNRNPMRSERIGGIAQPVVGDHPLAHAHRIHAIAHSHDLPAHIRPLNAREGDRTPAPSRVFVVDLVIGAACCCFVHGFGIPTGARVDVRVIEPARPHLDHHIVWSWLRREPVFVPVIHVDIAVARQHHRFHC